MRKIVYAALSVLLITGCSKDSKDDPQPSGNNPQPPVASFTYVTSGSSAPVLVEFTNGSTNATSYSWDFGDGGSSTYSNPTHTYNSPGVYLVELTATGPGGTDTESQVITVVSGISMCRISAVSILSCPLTTGGVGWDSFSAPDFYFNIETTSGTILLDGSSNYYTDLSTFPQAWNINPGYSIASADFQDVLKFHIWEHDSPDADDDVASCSFRPANYTTGSGAYPGQITLTNGTTQIKLTVIWQ